MIEKPKVSIIIVNYNGKSHLEKCLDSLRKIDYKNHEIILVDNNSTDNSLDFVKKKFPTIITIKLDKNYGFAHANNIGEKKAKGKFLLFLNNDTIVTPNFLSALLVMTDDLSIAIRQSLLLKLDGEVDSSGDYIDSLGVSYSSKNKIKNTKEIFSAKGAAMLVRKDVFELLNGFDKNFFTSFEDVDLCWRSRIIGYKVVVVPNSVVYHIGGATIRKMQSTINFHAIKNQISMRITNFETKFAIKSLFMSFLVYGTKILLAKIDYSFKGKTTIQATKYENKIIQKPSIKTILKSLVWIICNLKYLHQKRKWLKSHRIVKTNKMIKDKLILD